MARSSVLALGELERAVMDHLWAHAEAGDGPLTVREVHETVGKQRELAYTTVMTVLDRLTKKGLVTQAREDRAYRYAAASTRQELIAQTMRQTLDTLQSLDRRSAMLHFLDDASPQEINDLKSALAQIEQRSATPSVRTLSFPSHRQTRLRLASDETPHW